MFPSHPDREGRVIDVSEQQSRPDLAIEAAKAFGGADHDCTGSDVGVPVGNAYSTQLPPRRRLRAACRVFVDVRRLSDEATSRAVQGVADAPAGAMARVLIAPGQLPPAIALDYLCRYGSHLAQLVFEGDPQTVRTWWDELNAHR